MKNGFSNQRVGIEKKERVRERDRAREICTRQILTS
jgi:hypothetical protein